MVLGLRGFPNVQGGIEAHAEQLYPVIANLGCQVDVVVRTPYVSDKQAKEWRGIRFHPIWAPKTKGIEALIHTLLGVLYAALKRPDVLHIHAIGPAIWVPLARLLGLRVVVTHHGPDYDRQKWGAMARVILKLGERWGMRFANVRIVISRVIANLVQEKYGLDSVVIPNGVVIPETVSSKAALDQINLISGKYVLLVSRLVPEKRHFDLIEAFIKAELGDWKLVLVGASDHPDAYESSVLDTVANSPDVVSAGFQTGLALQELYAHAGLFVLPSSHEGLPIALLEALSFGLPVLASNIPANLEVGLPEWQYFPLGDIEALRSKIQLVASSEAETDKEKLRSWLAEKYSWNDIAKHTVEAYRK